MRLVVRNQLRRGVLILPSLFTLGNLCCGFYALVEATKGRYEGPDNFARAAVFIAVAMMLDWLDGGIARKLHAESAIGIQLDSLADVVAFGVAPAVLVYNWALVDLPSARLGWAVAFVFTSCGALRLARFNVTATSAHYDSRFFVGLPIPFGAAALAALVYLHPGRPAEPVLVTLVAAWTVAVSLLMVSTIRYRSFKQIDVNRRHPIRNLLWIVGALALLFAFPEEVLVVAIGLYVLSGPVTRLFRRGTRNAPEPLRSPDPGLATSAEPAKQAH